ncbi:MAG: CHAT domain-containing protein [Halobacteriota archaeon]
MSKFKLDWYAGASAQVEVFSPSSRREVTYKFKYTPPFRSTIRPPVQDIQLGPNELNPIVSQLDQLVTTLEPRAAEGEEEPRAEPQEAMLRHVEMIGRQLLQLIIPQYAQLDLRASGLFLEFGMDEALLTYPWELMHDGTNFMCLKHSVGRFVNGSMPIPGRQTPQSRMGSSLDKLSMLLISVPNPQPQNNRVFDPLPGAEAETEAICDVLSGRDDVELELLRDRDATYNNVWSALCKPHHIIHYNGHAFFDENKPYLSGLVLNDGLMQTGAINSYFTQSPPILCFINACETAKSAGWKKRYDIFDLARAFLDTGAYLLGSRWEINDAAATEFAKQFYKSLLVDGASLGKATLDARQRCRDNSPDKFAWASYVLYGDPRVCFKRCD